MTKSSLEYVIILYNIFKVFFCYERDYDKRRVENEI